MCASSVLVRHVDSIHQTGLLETLVLDKLANHADLHFTFLDDRFPSILPRRPPWH